MIVFKCYILGFIITLLAVIIYCLINKKIKPHVNDYEPSEFLGAISFAIFWFSTIPLILIIGLTIWINELLYKIKGD